MLDAPRYPKRLVAAKYHERRKSVLTRPLRIRQAIVEGVLHGHERDDALPRHVTAEIDDQVPQVVFFFRSDRAVSEKYERPATRETFHRMVGIDPGVHAFAHRELGTRRPQFGGNHGSA